jgi:glutamate-1-semialdehyde 2,1-aminomutase
VEVAERLCAVVPCAERVQFLKSGAEAVAAAVRIARTHTGRDQVIGSGYFGWADWSSAAAGVPSGTRGAFTAIPFDDIEALEAAVRAAGDRLAAVVLEPVVEALPSEEWMRRARELCDERGAVLVFDEIKTGFRIATGGYQEYAGITPDLATFGKAMANGYPLSAVVGRADVMAAADRTWISSTLAGESTALAAAIAVLDWHEQADIAESLWSIGADMRRAMADAIAASGVEGVTVDGIDPMWMLRFDAPAREARFLELARVEGVLFKRGAYNYPAIAHDEETLRAIESAASAAFVALRESDSAE